MTVASEIENDLKTFQFPGGPSFSYRFADRGKDILVLPGAFPWLQDLADRALEVGSWSRAGTIRGYTRSNNNLKQRDTHRIVMGHQGALAEYTKRLEAIEGYLALIYQQVANPYAIVDKINGGYQLLRYVPGQFFAPHVDVIKDNATLGQRRLAVIFLCNDAFEGGELVYTRTESAEGEPETVISGEVPGTVVIAPAPFTHPHTVKKVISGVRVSAVGWLC